MFLSYETKGSIQVVLHVVSMSNNYTCFFFVYVFKFMDFIVAKQVAKSLDFLLLLLPILLFVLMTLPEIVFDMEYFSEYLM